MEKEILVVDDQPGIRLLLQDLLVNEGYQVTIGETGKEAWDLICSHTFALAILDYRLPVLDGAEILDRLKQEEVDLAVILISGMTEMLSEDVIRQRNVKAVLGKPFNISDLLGQVHTILE
ncbi:response regulator [Virgibacillus xinjiangensis]|uniref:Response regulator n=1 Tax=Virgibacillus xinjiangensis TaxID=393090 RepID=A0ABV7CTH6_9BACI